MKPARAATGLVVLLAVLPLQWQVLAITPLGVLRPFHIAALVMLALAATSGVGAGWAAVAPGLRTVVLGVWLVTVPLVLAAVLGGWVWAEAVQNAVYAVVAVVAACLGWIALQSEGGRRVLALAAPVALVVFAVMFYRSSQAAGVSVTSALSRALGGDPNALMFGLFKAAFAQGDVDAVARTNFRHEIMGALLIAVAYSLAAARRTALVAVSSTLAVGFCVLSLSRSVLLALFLVALVLVFVAVSRASSGVAMALFFGVPALVAALLTVAAGLPSLLYERLFLDTAGYEGRLGAWDLEASEVAERLLIGGPPLDHSTHTLLGDAAMKGGLVAAVGAVILIGAAVSRWMALGRHCLHAGTSWPLVGGLLGCSVFISRAFTTGGGLLHLVAWMGLAAGVAVLCARSAVDEERRAVHLGGRQAQVDGSGQGDGRVDEHRRRVRRGDGQCRGTGLHQPH